MNTKQPKFFRQYQAHLRRHLEQPAKYSLRSARGLGHTAMAAGLQTLDLARFHEKLMVEFMARKFSSVDRAKIVRRAGKFFAEVITPIEKTHRRAQKTNVHLARANAVLKQRTAQLVASNQELKREILQRGGVEKALRNSQRHYTLLLEQSRNMQNQLRYLSHQVLSAQEDERKIISRELHDQIAQSLAGINILLSTLKGEAGVQSESFLRKIDRTQRLVEASVEIVHNFARDLRPALLDDLGLIPALHAFVKTFTQETGLRVSLRVFADVEKLDNTKRTVLYRVAQEALTNVARHARATAVEINMRKVEATACMTIRDNGKCPRQNPMLQARRGKRLGLVGMRERLEMVGGSFDIQCVEGKGTVVHAVVPFAQTRGGMKAR
jgi:signal transduction histidine kinase